MMIFFFFFRNSWAVDLWASSLFLALNLITDIQVPAFPLFYCFTSIFLSVSVQCFFEGGFPRFLHSSCFCMSCGPLPCFFADSSGFLSTPWRFSELQWLYLASFVERFPPHNKMRKPPPPLPLFQVFGFPSIKWRRQRRIALFSYTSIPRFVVFSAGFGGTRIYFFFLLLSPNRVVESWGAGQPPLSTLGCIHPHIFNPLFPFGSVLFSFFLPCGW